MTPPRFTATVATCPIPGSVSVQRGVSKALVAACEVWQRQSSDPGHLGQEAARLTRWHHGLRGFASRVDRLPRAAGSGEGVGWSAEPGEQAGGGIGEGPGDQRVVEARAMASAPTR